MPRVIPNTSTPWWAEQLTRLPGDRDAARRRVMELMLQRSLPSLTRLQFGQRYDLFAQLASILADQLLPRHDYAEAHAMWQYVRRVARITARRAARTQVAADTQDVEDEPRAITPMPVELDRTTGTRADFPPLEDDMDVAEVRRASNL